VAEIIAFMNYENAYLNLHISEFDYDKLDSEHSAMLLRIKVKDLNFYQPRPSFDYPQRLK
jgi:hypothetical protein